MSKKVLRIVSSPRGEASISIKLGNAIVEKIKAKYTDSIVTVRDLTTDFPHFEEPQTTSIFIAKENRTPEQAEAVKLSDELIEELHGSDIVVIDAPLYNLFVPSTLKAYIDHIVRAKETFRYNEDGTIEGLVKNKKVYVAYASGAVFSEDGAVFDDFVSPYLTQILGFIGITDIKFFRAEGVAIPGIQETALQKGIGSIVID
ncbi:MAG: NAD(P)H-dependent oxidoreductase [Chitinophagaceae bacterium]